MRPVLKKIPLEALHKYIKVDPSAVGVLRINFDALCQFLIQYHQRNFSVAEFENMIQSELNKKLLGKPVSIETINAICEYVDSVSIYLTHKRFKSFVNGELTEDTKKEFFHKNKDRYKEVLNRAKARNSQEYRILQEKINKRLYE